MMENIKRRDKQAYINYLIIFLIFIPFYNMEHPLFRYLGLISIGGVFLSSILNLLKSQSKGNELYIKTSILKPIIYGFLIIFSYIITLILEFKIINIKPIIQLILLLIYFFSLVNIDFSKINYKRLSFVFFIIILICYIPMLLGVGQVNIGYKGFFSTTTFLGIFSLFILELSFLAYQASSNKIFIVYMILSLLLIIKAQTRASLLGLIIIALTYVFLNFKKLRFIIWKLAKYVLLAVLVSLILIYPILDKFSWYPQISSFVYKATGKILMSGRNSIWAYSLELIKNKPILGNGFSAFSEFNISPHNSYIAIALQSGFFGLLTISMYINSLFNIMHKYRNDKVIRICTSFFIGNLAVAGFEVMLFQGQLVLSLLLWTIAGIGISKTMRIQEEENGI